MRNVSIYYCLLATLKLVLMSKVQGACKADTHPIYVQYFDSPVPASAVYDLPFPERCSEEGSLSGSGEDAEVVLDGGRACCRCGSDSLLCETLDDAFSWLQDEAPSEEGLYASVAVNGTFNSSAYGLLRSYSLKGNLGQIAIRGLGSVTIECAPGAGLVLREFNEVIIEGTSWQDCGLENECGPEACRGAIAIFDSYIVTLRDLTLVSSSGSGVVLDSNLEDSSALCNHTFLNCHFIANKQSRPVNGGGIYYFSDGEASCLLNVIETEFVSNTASNGGAIRILSYLATSICFLDCNFTNNTALKGDGGAVFVVLHNNSAVWTCESSHFVGNRALTKGGAWYAEEGNGYFWRSTSFSDNFAEMGGAIYFLSEHNHDKVFTRHIFSYCQWTNNEANTTGGAVYFHRPQNLSFVNCSWDSNLALKASAAILASNTDQVSIVNSNLVGNSVHSIFSDPHGANCIVNVISSPTFLTNVKVERNTGSGLCPNASDLTLSGTNTFKNNVGYKGGGINLINSSTLKLDHESILNVECNNATYGGGLYQKNFDDSDVCAFTYFESLSLKVTFQSNYGYITGNSIYLTNPTIDCSKTLKALNINTSNVSSPAAHLEFMDGPMNLVLGQNVTLNATVTDFFNNPTNVYVEMLLLQEGEELDLDVPYSLRGFRGFTIQNGITGTTVYLVGKNKSSDNYTFYFESESANIGTNVRLNLNVSFCPFGFVYNSTLSQCTCALLSIVQCNLNSPVATACIQKGYWFGQVNGIYVTELCLAGYCENSVNCTVCDNGDSNSEYCKLPEQDPDEQCSEYREGILCTECQANYSFTFGAVMCVSDETCQGAKVLIPFLVVVLFEVLFVVALVIVLKLGYGTSSAYMYGFVYYYSIVDTLIPHDKRNSYLLFIISIFQSLTQLNPRFLGYFNICFSTVMSILDQEFLQYVNPIFITIMVLGFVFLSRYCSKYVNFSDNTPVRAICLLILLSFTALSITSYRILAPITFTNVNHTYVNIEPSTVYFTGSHLVYFMIAALVMSVFVVPFTVFLLFAPCLIRVANLVRIKPFLDEFQGCYKDRYRWMAGFYFLCRLVYLLPAFANISTGREYTFQILSFGIVIFHTLLQPYKEYKLNIADTFLLTDITLITLLYGDTANILFPDLRPFRMVLTYMLIAFPTFILFYLFLSSFNFAGFCTRKKVTLLRRKISGRRQRSQKMSVSTTALLRPLVDNDGEIESGHEEYNWNYREPILELVESSRVGSRELRCETCSTSPPTSSIVSMDSLSYQTSLRLSTSNSAPDCNSTMPQARDN